MAQAQTAIQMKQKIREIRDEAEGLGRESFKKSNTPEMAYKQEISLVDLLALYFKRLLKGIPW